MNIKQLLALSCISLFSVSANAVLINFDDLPGSGTSILGTTANNSYNSLGVTFSGEGSNDAFFWNISPIDGNYLSNYDGTVTLPYGNYFDITFNELASNVSLLLQSHGTHSSGINFDVFSSTGDIIENVLTEGAWVNVSFTSTGIASIRVSNTINGWVYGIDDLSFDTQVVPVPSAVWLFGSGLLSFIGIARRKV